MKPLAIFLITLVHALTYLGSESLADTDFKQFYGHYVGNTADETPNRQIDVKIKAHDPGFNVTWTTTYNRANNNEKKSTFSINFRPSKQIGVYGSAMIKDLFGNETALDPLNGDPYVWAFINGKTMTVNSLLVSENGGYEIQTYKRTLTIEGMSLEYSSVQDGKILKQINGTMKKIK